MLARLTNEIINEISELHQMFIFNNDESAMVKISLPSVFGLDRVLVSSLFPWPSLGLFFLSIWWDYSLIRETNSVSCDVFTSPLKTYENTYNFGIKLIYCARLRNDKKPCNCCEVSYKIGMLQFMREWRLSLGARKSRGKDKCRLSGIDTPKFKLPPLLVSFDEVASNTITWFVWKVGEWRKRLSGTS